MSYFFCEPIGVNFNRPKSHQAVFYNLPEVVRNHCCFIGSCHVEKECPSMDTAKLN